MKKAFVTAVGLVALATGTVHGQVIDFDDIPTFGNYLTPVPPDYLGHVWSGDVNGGGRGYVDLLSAINRDYLANLDEISEPNIFYNGFGDEDCWVLLSEDRSLESFHYTRWPNVGGSGAPSVHIVGYNDGNVVYDQTFNTIEGQWQVVEDIDVTVDEIHFLRPPGTPTWWLIDDLTLGAGGPSLEAEGSCPGSMTFNVSGATPGGNVAFIYAFGTGSVEIPPDQPCAGTVLGLNGTATLGGVATANANGEASFTANVPAPACGRVFVQALDVSSCGTTNVVGI